MVAEGEADTGDRLVVVGARPSRDTAFLARLRARYSSWKVTGCPSYLSAIADVSREGARAVLAEVDATTPHLSEVVGGLRTAAGSDARVVLLCGPESEPRAMESLSEGADDYVLNPIDERELDVALGYARVDSDPRLTDAPSASLNELRSLGSVLAAMHSGPREMLSRAASLVRLALSARGAMVVVEGTSVTEGESVVRPVLTSALTDSGGAMVGRISVGESDRGAYTSGDAEKLSHWAAVLSHVLEAASRQREWRKLAVTDECSGLPNRRFLLEELDAVLRRAAVDQFPVTVLLFDVDDFKQYNDRFGHDAGDEIIRAVGELFRGCCREHDKVARYGGDEFAEVFWDPEGPRSAGSKLPESALSVVDRFKDDLRSHRFALVGEAGAAHLTISGGMATYPWNASTRDELIRRADEALLAAKRAGKNRILVIGAGGERGPRESGPLVRR
jgi:diguanylate cyclase (GGDEF)-like protein